MSPPARRRAVFFAATFVDHRDVVEDRRDVVEQGEQAGCHPSGGVSLMSVVSSRRNAALAASWSSARRGWTTRAVCRITFTEFGLSSRTRAETAVPACTDPTLARHGACRAAIGTTSASGCGRRRTRSQPALGPATGRRRGTVASRSRRRSDDHRHRWCHHRDGAAARGRRSKRRATRSTCAAEISPSE